MRHKYILHSHAYLLVGVMAYLPLWLSTVACTKWLSQSGMQATQRTTITLHHSLGSTFFDFTAEERHGLYLQPKWDQILKKTGEFLESYGSQVDIEDPAIAWHYAVWRHNLDQLSLLCANPYTRSYVNSTVNGSVTPLHLAAYQGFDDTITMLIDHGAKADAAMQDGIYPIHVAAFHGFEHAITRLLAKGANAQDGDIDGRTALHWAVCGSHINAVSLLLNQGSDLNQTDNHHASPLCLAFYHQNSLLVKELIRFGAKPYCSHCMEGNSYKLLEWAVIHQDTDCLKEILNSPNLLLPTDWKNKKSSLLIIKALKNNNMPLVKLLVSNQQGMAYKDRYGNTLLHLAAKANAFKLIPRLASLIKKKIINHVNSDQYTPLH